MTGQPQDWDSRVPTREPRQMPPPSMTTRSQVRATWLGCAPGDGDETEQPPPVWHHMLCEAQLPAGTVTQKLQAHPSSQSISLPCSLKF